MSKDIEPNPRAHYVAQILIMAKQTEESVDYFKWMNRHNKSNPPKETLYQACIDVYESMLEAEEDMNDKKTKTLLPARILKRVDELLQGVE